MKKEETIRVVLLEPHQMAKTVEVKNTLEGLQELVKGNIEPFYPLSVHDIYHVMHPHNLDNYTEKCLSFCTLTNCMVEA